MKYLAILEHLDYILQPILYYVILLLFYIIKFLCQMITPNVAVSISIRIELQFFGRLYRIDINAVDKLVLSSEYYRFSLSVDRQNMLLLLFPLDRAQPKKFSVTTQRVCYLANNSNRQFQLFVYFVNLQMSGDIFSTGGRM